MKQKLDMQALENYKTKAPNRILKEIQENRLLSKDVINKFDPKQIENVLEDYIMKEQNDLICK